MSLSSLTLPTFHFQSLPSSECTQRAKPGSRASPRACAVTLREFPAPNWPGWRMVWTSPPSCPNSSPCKVHRSQCLLLIVAVTPNNNSLRLLLLKWTLDKWELPACVSFPVLSHCLYVLLIYLRCCQRGWLVCLNHIRWSIGSQRVNPVYWSDLSLKFIFSRSWSSEQETLFSDQ